jgi:hypothetical protein
VHRGDIEARGIVGEEIAGVVDFVRHGGRDVSAGCRGKIAAAGRGRRGGRGKRGGGRVNFSRS